MAGAVRVIGVVRNIIGQFIAIIFHADAIVQYGARDFAQDILGVIMELAVFVVAGHVAIIIIDHISAVNGGILIKAIGFVMIGNIAERRGPFQCWVILGWGPGLRILHYYPSFRSMGKGRIISL